MAPYNLIFRMILAFEDHIVTAILRQPGFHRAVGRIQRTVDDQINGRNPNEPLYPGEATENPDAPRRKGFFKHFFDELGNQAQGKPTELDTSVTKPTKRP